MTILILHFLQAHLTAKQYVDENTCKMANSAVPYQTTCWSIATVNPLYTKKTLPHYILEESNFNFRYVRLWDLHIPREKWLNCLQTVEILIRLIRRRILRRLIWVCTVCQLPFYRSPDYNGLRHFLELKSIDTFSYLSWKMYVESLEVPQGGASNEYPQHRFWWRNKKNNMWIPQSALAC